MKRIIYFLFLPLFTFNILLAYGDSINQDWYSQALENIKKQEYHITYSEELNSYQSPNRKNNLRFIYKNNGFSVSPRVTETYKIDENDPLKEREKIKVSDSWHVEFTVLGYGRNNKIEKKFEGSNFIVDDNLAYVKDNNMKVDYVNNEGGMRQNFTIYNKPKIDKGFLTLNFNINTQERVIVGSDALIIKNKKSKEFMKYNSLKIWDAEGKELRGWFKAIKNNVNEETKKLQIVVNDENAKYPIIIDPLSSTENWSAEIDQAEAKFGFSVSTAGDVNNDGFSDIIIGAPYYDDEYTDQGAAFLYLGSAAGLGTTPHWQLFGHLAGYNFGYRVTTAGDVNGDGHSDVLISAPFAGPSYAENGGIVYLYYGVTTFGLSYLDAWYGQKLQTDANFGYSISTAGDVNGDGYSDFIIGAPGFFNGGLTDEGYVYVYHGSASGPNFAPQDWIYRGNQIGARLGTSVSTAGDVNGDGYSDVIVSAPNYDNGQTDEGTVFVFHGSATGLSENPDWTDEGDQINAHFGKSVSTAGDYNGDGYSDIIIGSPDFDTQVAGSTVNDAGIFSIHFGSSTGISSYQFLEGVQLIANMGKSVFTAGDINGDGFSDVVVGLNIWTAGSLHGAAHVYRGSANGLITSPNWIGTNNLLLFDGYGYSVSTAGDVNGDGFSDIIVGVPSYSNGENQEGAVFVYNGSSDGLSLNDDWSADANQASASFGTSVSAAGDVNGDGFSDVIIGASSYDNGQNAEGAAFVYHGSSTGLSLSADWSAESNQEVAFFGKSVSTAGDVNGDGYDDVIIGSYYYSNGETNEGAAFVYHGSSTGLSSTTDWFAESNQSNSYYGFNVGTAGDINGDGYSDVIVGAYLFDNGQFNEGSAFVYYGSSSGLSLTENWNAEGNKLEARFGCSVSTAGDVNGDGFSDVIVGAYEYTLTSLDEGAAFLYYGSSAGLSQVANWSAYGSQLGAFFGYSVSTAGDVNGDGFSDVIIGGQSFDVGAIENGGAALVYHGSVSGLSSTADWSATGNQIDAKFGISVSTAGDVNGDGFSDVIVGEAYFDNDLTDEGAVYVYHGSTTGLSLIEDWSVEGNQTDSRFGFSVSTAGDVNGDGYTDVIVGASLYDNTFTDEGKVFLYYGNSGNGLDSRTRQNNPSNGSILAAGNLTESNGQVQIGLRTKSPFGRADGRIVYEFRINGEPFSSGESISNSGEYDGTTTFEDLNTNPNGKPIIKNVSGLNSYYENAYQWRARKEFSIVNNPYQKYGPWKYYHAFSPIQPYAFRPRVFIPLNVIAQIKILLEGSYDETNNNMFIANNINIPSTSPYSEDPKSTPSIPSDAVDWVLVQLRDKNDNTKVLASKSAFLLQDKTIRELDGQNPISFNLPADDYYIVVKHRNHLPVMSANPVPLTAN